MPTMIAVVCLSFVFLIRRKEKLNGIDKIIQNASLTYSDKVN